MTYFKKIVAIIVTHNSDSGIESRVKSLLPQIDHLCIIDNGSSNTTILKEFGNKRKITFIDNGKNLGLGAAQNIGITFARKNGADWVLLLDDDSTPDLNMVETMKQEYGNHSEKNLISIIAPYIDDTNTTKEHRYIRPVGTLFFKRVMLNKGETSTDILSVIASGSLIKLDNDVIMDETFFIDYIDTDFALRTISRGRKILVVRNAILHHTLGNKTEIEIGFVKLIPTNHSPKRRFTIYRNRVILWRRFFLKSPNYITYDILAAFYDVLRIFILEKNKKEKIKYAASGILAGLFANKY